MIYSGPELVPDIERIAASIDWEGNSWDDLKKQIHSRPEVQIYESETDNQLLVNCLTGEKNKCPWRLS